LALGTHFKEKLSRSLRSRHAQRILYARLLVEG
jgi:hypothetical protein